MDLKKYTDEELDMLFENIFDDDLKYIKENGKIPPKNKLSTYRNKYEEGQIITQIFYGSFIPRRYKILKKYEKFCICQFLDKGFYKFCMNYMDIYNKQKVKLY